MVLDSNRPTYLTELHHLRAFAPFTRKLAD
nr:MAG TPA: hypothetical protein [Caudoviricetes sp.]